MAVRWPTTASRRGVVDRGEEVELALGLVAAAPEHGLDDRLVHEHQALARVAEGVERARLDQRLDGALVQHRRVDAVAEVVEVGERPALVARRDDVHHHALAHVAHRGEPEPHAAPASRTEKSDTDSLTSGTSTSMPIWRHSLRKTAVWSLLVLTRREQRGEVLDRVVRLQPRGLVRHVAVPDRVRLVERVVGERLDGVEDPLAELLRVTLRDAARRRTWCAPWR